MYCAKVKSDKEKLELYEKIKCALPFGQTMDGLLDVMRCENVFLLKKEKKAAKERVACLEEKVLQKDKTMKGLRKEIGNCREELAFKKYDEKIFEYIGESLGLEIPEDEPMKRYFVNKIYGGSGQEGGFQIVDTKHNYAVKTKYSTFGVMGLLALEDELKRECEDLNTSEIKYNIKELFGSSRDDLLGYVVVRNSDVVCTFLYKDYGDPKRIAEVLLKELREGEKKC